MNNLGYDNTNVVIEQQGQVAKSFFARVFTWMFAALCISAATAYLMQVTGFYANLYTVNESTGRTSLSLLGWGITFAPLLLVITLSAGINRLSYGAAVAVFLIYSVLTGASLSFILLAYTNSSIMYCFAGAAAVFGVMAVMGYTTNVDLSRFGGILMAALIGMVIISLINMFMGSETIDYILSLFGVALFTALTAYDAQKIKRLGMAIEQNGSSIAAADAGKAAIMGALSLYLDFINLFLFILRLFGNRR